MMKDRIRANRETVFAACEDLFRAGERITMPAVRERVGGGSQGTIIRYVREWEARHLERFLELEQREPLPPSAEVPPELWRVVLPVWRSLVEAANAVGLAAARKEMAESVSSTKPPPAPSGRGRADKPVTRRE